MQVGSRENSSQRRADSILLSHRRDIAEQQSFVFLVIHQSKEQVEIWSALVIGTIKVRIFAEARTMGGDHLDSMLERPAQVKRIAQQLILFRFHRFLFS